MNVIEHLLACANEECLEVAKEADKALRFGFDDRDPRGNGNYTNAQLMVIEANELIAVLDMLAEQGVIPVFWRETKEAEDIRAEKTERLISMMHYARERGTLHD